MSEIRSKKELIPSIIIGFIFLQYLHYFDYVKYDVVLGGNICKIMAIFVMLVFIFGKYTINVCPSKKYVIGFVFIPMLSFIPCFFEHGQSFMESFRVYLPYMILFLYFYMHKEKISVKTLINILTIYAVVRTSIVIVEQFTYPNYLFAFRPETYDENGILKPIEVRSGIYRYYISDTYFSQFLIFYYFQKMTEKYRLRYLVFFVFGLVGLYLDQTRQFMVTTVLALVIISLLSSNFKHKKLAISLIIFSGIVILNFSDILFGSLMSKTSDELNEDNIRYLSYYTYFSSYWGGPLSYIFGNGMAGNSAYGIEMQKLTLDYGLWRADVGIVGFLNQYGYVSVLYFLLFYILYLRKNWKYIDVHLQMFFLASLLNLPLVVFFVNNANWYVFWAFMMYLLDEAVVRNKNLAK